MKRQKRRTKSKSSDYWSIYLSIFALSVPLHILFKDLQIRESFFTTLAQISLLLTVYALLESKMLEELKTQGHDVLGLPLLWSGVTCVGASLFALVSDETIWPFLFVLSVANFLFQTVVLILLKK